MDPNRKALDLYGHYYLVEVVEVEEKLAILVILALQEQLEILELELQVILVLRGLLVIILALLVNRGPVLFLLLVSLVI